MKALDLARGEIEAVEILAEASLDAGPQNFDRHCACAAIGLAHARLMHLRDGRGGNRLAERRIELICLLSQGLPDRAFGLIHSKWRQLVLKLAEIARQLRPDNIAPRCQKLAQLDVARPECRQRLGQSRLAPFALAAEWRCHPAQQTGRRRHIRPVRQHGQAVPEKHQPCPSQPGQIDKRTDHMRLIASVS